MYGSRHLPEPPVAECDPGRVMGRQDVVHRAEPQRGPRRRTGRGQCSLVRLRDCVYRRRGLLRQPPGRRSDRTRALAESWDGKTWSIVRSPNVGAAAGSELLSSVSVRPTEPASLSATEQTARSSNSGTARSGRWHQAQTWGPLTRATQLAAVSCSSTRDCTAVGFYTNGHNGTLSKTLVESWDGARWSIVPSANVPGRGDGLSGVSCVSAAACVAVGSYNHPVGAHFSPAATLVESWDGRKWSIVPSPNEGLASDSDELNSVSCASSITCVAVGSTPRTSSSSLGNTADGLWSPSLVKGPHHSTTSSTASPALGDLLRSRRVPQLGGTSRRRS